MQYCSLYEYDGGGEVDPDDWLRCAGPQRTVAHLAFDPARYAPPTATHHALFQDLIQHCLMQGASGPRGKARLNCSIAYWRSFLILLRHKLQKPGDHSAFERLEHWLVSPEITVCAGSPFSF